MANYPIVKCPHCFRAFRGNNVVFRCDSGERKTDPYLKSYHRENGNPAFERADYGFVDPANLQPHQLEIGERGFIIGVTNPDTSIRTPLSKKLCPYCHNELPRRFGECETKYIAVVGVSNSGKTTYLAATNDSLSKKNWNWGSVDSEKSRLLDQITDMYAMNDPDAQVATKETQGPYYYYFIPPTAEGATAVPQHLVFFDAPGEFYVSADKINRSLATFLSQADGIIFIVNAAEELEKSAAGSRVNVNSILQAFQESGILTDKKIAIVFNKLDKIKSRLGLKSIDEFIPPATGDDIDPNKIKTQSDTIRALMLGNGAQVQNPTQILLSSYMTKIEKVFGNNCKLFATRLLLEDDKGNFTFMSQGAETPLLWLLSECGAFPKKAPSK